MKTLSTIIVVVVLIVGGLGIASYGNSIEDRVAALEAQVETLQSQVQLLTLTTNSALKMIDTLKSQIAALQAKPLSIAYLNVEDAFTVFTDAVKDLRQKAMVKQMEITRIQQDFLASKISKEAYQAKYQLLQVELLQAQLNIDIGVINRMIAAPGFSDMQSDLERLRDQTQPVVSEMNKLVQTVQTGVVDSQGFQSRYTEVKNAYTQLDQLLTQAAMAKIAEAANKVAEQNGYDLVLRVKNVIIYRNTAKLTDITDQVKHELASYLQ